MSDLRGLLESGRPILGTMLSEVGTPNVMRILRAGGFDFVIIDCEHGYFSYDQVAALTAVCNGIGFPVVVRVPGIARESVVKYLDMGADGLLFPMVDTKEDMETAVELAKYPPLGRRGVSITRPHAEYAPPPLEEYIRIANRRTVLLAQIETRQALDNLDSILETRGVDAVLVGPSDLSMDLGVPGNLGAPRLRQAIESVIAAARRAGKPCGIITGSIPLIQWCRNLGATLFSCNSEAGMLLQTSRAIVEELREMK